MKIVFRYLLKNFWAQIHCTVIEAAKKVEKLRWLLFEQLIAIFQGRYDAASDRI